MCEMELSRDIVLVNLRVLAKLRQGDRLQCADSRYFGIDRGSWWIWTAVSRWIARDNRNNMLDRVESIFRAASKLQIQDKDKHLASAKVGVRELICTYAGDPTTVARLENLMQEPVLPVAEETSQGDDDDEGTSF